MPATPPSRPLSLFFLLLCLPALSIQSSLPETTATRKDSAHTGLRVSKRSFLPLSWSWPWSRGQKRATELPAGYFNPLDAGGSFLTKAPNTFPPSGEPLNIIITSPSTPAVLANQEQDGGFLNYMLGIGFSGECLGQHQGDSQTADLGDGDGYKNETAVLRWNYGDPALGTCTETIKGGNHFRYWYQNGPNANSSAIFLATSYEMPIAQQHDIIPDGYNLGRDWLIGNITHSPIDTYNLTNTSTFTGTTSSAGYVYSSSISYVSGLLANSSIGVNHNNTVPVKGLNAVDGLVAVVEVTITTIPANATKGKSGTCKTVSVVPPRITSAIAGIIILFLGALSL
ncbi:hypothetical protein MIND_00588500 [Mycena indigotica]|uniref:Uncharacterized protein n=1 Tax=Mycena indigotica TaxID=2126181 RepID=A0A8H6SRJ2_9AGAR|nr:uncharacterized protein MIND_00588500 [Mycena indigotica]KAF7303592.1 hypothetical protein MIND_00588500 [Mycena indigotica]